MNLSDLSQIKPAAVVDFLKKVDKKTWIKIAAAGLCAVIALFFIIGPAWFQRVGVKKKIKKVRAQMQTTDALFRKKPELLRNKDEYANFISSAKARIYEAGESALLLGVISKMAQESKVSIIASTPKNFEGKFPNAFEQQYEGNMYDFTVEGSYHDLASFVARIESNPKLLRVGVFRIEWREESPKTHLANLTLSAVSLKKASA